MELDEPYACCRDKNTKPEKFSESDNNWFGKEIGYDGTEQWCGITERQLCYNELDYKFYKECKEFSPGWGIEDNDWCIIPVTCSMNK